MLKVGIHIVLSVLLLVATTGLAISKHYCGGELISTSVLGEAESCCDSGDCCKNETEHIQLDVDYSVSATVVLPESVQMDLIVFTAALFNVNEAENTKLVQEFLTDSHPPPKLHTSLAIRQSYLL